VILAISIILWALMYFPRSSPQPVAGNQPQSVLNNDQQTTINEPLPEGEQLRNSFAGRLGHTIEPVIRPLGFDWKIGVALIASFAAREVLVSTLSIIYNVGKDENEQSETLISAIRNAKDDNGQIVWTPLTALTLMVFFVLAMQCMSTVAIVRRETNSWSWTLFMVSYMTALAYFAAFITYQGGKLLGFQ
jgi:ferrous iron transport protein B